MGIDATCKILLALEVALEVWPVLLDKSRVCLEKFFPCTPDDYPRDQHVYVYFHFKDVELLQYPGSASV